ncbi:hypothetical protein D3C78_763870 [compost metagenome]
MSSATSRNVPGVDVSTTKPESRWKAPSSHSEASKLCNAAWSKDSFNTSKDVISTSSTPTSRGRRRHTQVLLTSTSIENLSLRALVNIGPANVSASCSADIAWSSRVCEIKLALKHSLSACCCAPDACRYQSGRRVALSLIAARLGDVASINQSGVMRSSNSLCILLLPGSNGFDTEPSIGDCTFDVGDEVRDEMLILSLLVNGATGHHPEPGHLRYIVTASSKRRDKAFQAATA